MTTGKDWRRHFPGLASLPDTEARDIDACARRVSWTEGACVFRPGDAAATLRLLVSGQVRVQHPSGRALLRVDAGRGCALVNGYLMADAGDEAEGRAEAETEAYIVPRALIDAALARSPAFRARIIQACSDHIVDLRLLIEEIAVNDLEPRLAEALLARKEAGGEGNVSAEDLSVALGSSAATVAGLLDEFQRRGWVFQKAGALRLTDRVALERASRSESTQG